MKPIESTLSMAMSMLNDATSQSDDQTKQAKTALKRQITELGKKQDALVERLIETSNPKVIAALETKIAKLDEDKLRLSDKITQNTKPQASMGQIFELLREFLSNPWIIYDNGPLAVKKTILKTAFKAPLAYDRQNGFRTPQVSVIFEFLGFFTSECKMVRVKGTVLNN